MLVKWVTERSMMEHSVAEDSIVEEGPLERDETLVE